MSDAVVVGLASIGAVLLWLAVVFAALLAYFRLRRKGCTPPVASCWVVAAAAAAVALVLLSARWWAPHLGALAGMAVYAAAPQTVSLLLLWLVHRWMPQRPLRRAGQRQVWVPLYLFAVVCGLAAVALLVFGVVLEWQHWGTGKKFMLDKVLAACGGLIALAAWLWRTGERVDAPPAQALMQADARPPVLYLRAFSQESQYFAVGRKRDLGAYSHSLSATLAKDDQLVGLTLEDYLDEALSEAIGPFVALGNPEDYIPPEGARRVYMEDHAWKDALLDMARGAACILVEVGRSDNLGWEFQALARLGLRHKLMVLSPPLLPGGTGRQARSMHWWNHLRGIQAVPWPDFAASLQAWGYQLPADSPGPGVVLGFLAEGQVRTLATGAVWPKDYALAVQSGLADAGAALASDAPGRQAA